MTNENYVEQFIKHNAGIEIIRKHLWLEIIGLDEELYRLYLKYPTSLPLIRAIQEMFDDLRDDQIQERQELMDIIRYKDSLIEESRRWDFNVRGMDF